ncbi:MAG TPA: BTAD domain-containing putative transcriptional regulator [Gemmatimonadaceae bacterium]|nr:BTAD domain-containing putative transcriptional regulator [Gemmatimonadaceae bacterium]
MSELLTLGRVRLVADDGAESKSLGLQPKRLALLAYLALESAEAPVPRDTLLALFWPELGDQEARRALRQALHYLRRVVTEDVFVTTGDVIGVQARALRCDAVDLERLIASGQNAKGLELYRGDFCDGFHVADVAPELEEWMARTRARLRNRAAAAAWAESDAAMAASDPERAVGLARMACAMSPDPEIGWRRLIALQERVGDREGALRTFDELASRLRQELDTEPSAETVALANQIRIARAPDHAVPGEASAPDDVAPPPPVAEAAPIGGPARKPWWYRPTVIVAVAVVVVAVAALVTYRRSSDANDTSLVATGALSGRDRVIVADFVNLAGDSLLAAGITEAFRVDLSQSPLVRVMSPRQVATALERMRQPAGAALSDSVAREIALREGAKAIVTGSVANMAGAFTVTASLVSSERGEVLAAVRETAADSTGLLEAVDRVSRQLRYRIGESLRSLRALAPLYDETTNSLAALRIYTEGTRLRRMGRRAEAIRLFEQAIALDTAFASAYVALSGSYDALGEPGRALAMMQQAIRYQERLPFVERTFAVGGDAYRRGDYETAIGVYTRYLERYPDDIRGINNLALIYQDTRRFAKAESLFTRAAALDSTVANLYFGIHGTQLLQGKFGESRATLDLIARRFPGNIVQLAEEMHDASAQHHWEEAERISETLLAAANGDTLTMVDPVEARAEIVMTQGRLAEAERIWRTQLVLSAAAGSRGRHLFGAVQLARLELRHRRAPERALRLVDSTLAAISLDSVLPGDRPYYDLARFYASAGRLTRARELFSAGQRNDSVLARTPGADAAWARGVIALAEGRPTVAESELRQAAEGLYCTMCALPDLARAYEATNKPDAAVVVYERYLATPWFWRYETDAVELGWAMKRLAELYRDRGDDAKAAAVRDRLLVLWRRADPELQAVLAEVRGGSRG